MGGAVLDVVSGGGAVVHAREAFHRPSVGDVGWLALAFDLVGDVYDLEIRLHVAESTELKVRSYRVGLRSESQAL